MEGTRRSKRKASQLAAELLHQTITKDKGKAAKKRRASASDAEELLAASKKRKRVGTDTKATYSSGDFLCVRCDGEEQFWLCKPNTDVNRHTWAQTSFNGTWLEFIESTPTHDLYKVGDTDHIDLDSIICATQLASHIDAELMKSITQKEEERRPELVSGDEMGRFWKLPLQEKQRVLLLLKEDQEDPESAPEEEESEEKEEQEEKEEEKKDKQKEDPSRRRSSTRIKTLQIKKQEEEKLRAKEEKEKNWKPSMLRSWRRSMLDALILQLLRETKGETLSLEGLATAVKNKQRGHNRMTSVPANFALRPLNQPQATTNEEDLATTELELSLQRLVSSDYLRVDSKDETKQYVLRTHEGIVLREHVKPARLSKKQKKALEREKQKDEEKERKLRHANVRVAHNWKLRQEREAIEAKRAAFFQKHHHLFAPFLVQTKQKGRNRKGKADKETNGQVAHSEANGNEGKGKEKEKEKEAEEGKEGENKQELIAQPKCIINGTMREYQLKGLQWLVGLHENGVGGILADEMGLGKTLQMISFLAYLKEHGVEGPHLVVCPLSVLSAWMSEFNRWCPSLRAFRYHASMKSERKRLQKDVFTQGGFDVCVTTYESLLAASNFFRGRFAWRYVIVDEAQRIKNEETLLSKALRGVRCYNPILLTGTPLQNNLHELWALLNFLFPEVFTSSELFDQTFDLSKSMVKHELLEKVGPMLAPIMLRRVKTEVEPNLPPKTETKVYVPLSSYQIFWYKRLLSRSSALLDTAAEEDAVEGEEWKRLMSLLMQLRKVCNHPYMLPNSEPEPYTNGSHLLRASGKLMVLDKLLTRLHEEGSRVLVFSQFTNMLDILEDYCAWRGWRYARLDGGTSRVRRMIDIRSFNTENSDLFLFLISTRAGGLGINLATANIVIHYDSDWNPQVDLQAQDRSHRIGQTQEVHVYRLISEGTVEERIVNRAEQKLYLDTVVTGGRHRVAQPGTLSTQDLLPMLKFGAERIFTATGEMGDEDIDAILKRSEAKGKETEEEQDHRYDPTTYNVDIKQLAIREFQGKSYEKETNKSIAEEWAKRETERKEAKKKRKEEEKAGGGKTEEEGAKKRAERERKSRFTVVDSYTVLKSQVEEDDEEKLGYVSTNIQKKKTNKFISEDYCYACKDGGKLICCLRCPRVYHTKCLTKEQQSKGRGGMWSCPQHNCQQCGRGASAAGGLLFCCMICPSAYCEDHVPYNHTLIGDCEALVELGYRPNTSTFIICSKECEDYSQKNAFVKSAMLKGEAKTDDLLQETTKKALLKIVGKAKKGNLQVTQLGQFSGIAKRMASVEAGSSLLVSLYSMLYPPETNGVGGKETNGKESKAKKKRRQEDDEENEENEESENEKEKEKEKEKEDAVLLPPMPKETRFKEKILAWQGAENLKSFRAMKKVLLRILTELESYSKDSLILLGKLLGCGVQYKGKEMRGFVPSDPMDTVRQHLALFLVAPTTAAQAIRISSAKELHGA